MSGPYGSFVIPTMLASEEQLTTWTSSAAPENVTPILRSCSTMVLDASLGAAYDVDPLTGLATDPLIKQTLMEATCIQAAAWIALGINPLAGGINLGGVKKSKKIGSASFEMAGAEQAAAAKAAAVRALVPEARSKLLQRNLIGEEPVSL